MTFPPSAFSAPYCLRPSVYPLLSSSPPAGHVGISARHSNHFRVSVNTEAHASVTFFLLYEELLQRRAGIYEHVINLTPRQKLREFAIEVKAWRVGRDDIDTIHDFVLTGSHSGEPEPHPPARAGAQAARGLGVRLHRRRGWKIVAGLE